MTQTQIHTARVLKIGDVAIQVVSVEDVQK